MVTEVPPPGDVTSRTVPPDSCAMPYTWLSPSPLPDGCFVVKNGSNARRATSSVMPTPVSVTMIAT